ncbi:MAG: hypothetical protein RJA22_2409 [Verrucomicrobiota bacterium]|jgi:uncharacterized membrane protein (UPF0127 family)
MTRTLRALPLLAFLLAGCSAQPPGPAAPGQPAAGSNAVPPQYHLNQAQPKLRTLKLYLGAHELEAELAINVTEVATGMMYRTNMTDAEGMLFAFALPGPRSFYMRNCVLPLSAAYVDDQGVIDQIIDLHPGVETPVPSRSDRIKYVLEVPQGWFQRFQVGTGTVINTAAGPLKQFSGILQ